MTKKWLWFGLAILVSLLVGYKVATPQHFHTHDDIQIFRTNEYAQCFRDGQFPCRWSRDLGKGYGYPLFIFYPPAIYAIPALISQIPGVSIAFALNILAYLTFPLAAISMYRLIVVLTKRDELAFVGSSLFTLLPYHAVNIFVRGVYAENLVWAITPLLLAEVYLVIVAKKRIWPLSILGALILLTHNISAMILAPVLLLWAIGVIATDWAKHRSSIIRLIISALFAVGISSFFLVPALVEKPLVQTESMIFDYYSYLVHFPSIKQIFLSNNWGYGGSSWGVVDDGMSFSLGQVQWGMLFVSVFAGILVNRKKIKSYLNQPIAWALGIALLLLLFLTHPRSTPIWIMISPLQYIQFPWRLVGMSGVLTVGLSTYLLSQLPKKIGIGIGVTAVILAATLYAPYFRPEKYDGLVDSDYINGSLRGLQQEAHLFDYLPKTVMAPPSTFATELIYSYEKPIESEVIEWKSNKAKLIVKSKDEQTITLSIYNYPGWSLSVNGKEAEIITSKPMGLTSIKVQATESLIEMSWQETTIRKIANAISCLSMAIVICMIILGKKGKNE